MNFFETKKVKVYKHINDNKGDVYGDTHPRIQYVCDLMVDIQPATAKLLEKEFGMVNEATYVLWTETVPSKNMVIDKDMYVKFEYEDYKNLYQVVDRSRWLGNDEFFDDYTSFSVKLVDDMKEDNHVNGIVSGSINVDPVKGKVDKHHKKEELPKEEDEEEDDYYG